MAFSRVQAVGRRTYKAYCVVPGRLVGQFYAEAVKVRKVVRKRIAVRAMLLLFEEGRHLEQVKHLASVYLYPKRTWAKVKVSF